MSKNKQLQPFDPNYKPDLADHAYWWSVMATDLLQNALVSLAGAANKTEKTRMVIAIIERVLRERNES